MGWSGPVLSDSGGFQVWSLIRQDPARGVIRDHEVVFREPSTGQKWILTPERVVQLQFQLGSDVVVCLAFFKFPHTPNLPWGGRGEYAADWRLEGRAVQWELPPDMLLSPALTYPLTPFPFSRQPNLFPSPQPVPRTGRRSCRNATRRPDCVVLLD